MRAGALVICAALATRAHAVEIGDDPICAARPGKGTPPCTVPAGRLQIETGLADWSRSKSGGERETDVTLGETGVKFGLNDRSDLEVDVTPWQQAKLSGGVASETNRGFGDVVIAYKYRLTGSEAALQVAALPMVKIPTAKRPLGNRKLEASLLIPVSYSLSGSNLSLGATPELDWVADSDGSGHHLAMAQVAGVGWQATSRLNFSAELWGQWDWDPDGTGRQVSADGAAAYLVNDDLQLDAGANFGLNRQTPGLELYAGVSKRF